MTELIIMELFPFDIYCEIIGTDIDIYRGLLSIPCFARLLTIGKVFDMAIKFGFGVEIQPRSLDYRTRSRGAAIKYTLNGLKHRVGGPALEYANGFKKYYYKGQLHSTTTPSKIYKHEYSDYGDWYYYIWYCHGLIHRLNGPAIESRGSQIWCQNNKRHRVDGPAVIIKYIRYVAAGNTVCIRKWYIDDKWQKTEKVRTDGTVDVFV